MPNESFAPATVVPQANGDYAVQYGNDKGLFVEFDTMPEEQTFESEKTGQKVFKDIEIIRIYTPGKTQPMVRRVQPTDTPNQPSDINRWPRQYEAFKKKTTLAPEGFALEHWPVVTKSDVLNLKGFNIHTVEQLSQVPDTVAQTIMGGHGLRTKAQAFLASSKDGAALAMRQATQLKEQEGEIKALQKQLKELSEQMEKLGKEPKK